MTISLLFGAGLFVLLLFVFLLVLKTQVSPQSAMLEEVVRETRLRKKAPDSDTRVSSVFMEWLAAPVAFLRGFFSPNPDAAIMRRLAAAGYKEPSQADLFLGARLAVPALFGVTVALLIPENVFFFFAIAVIVGFFAPDFWLAEAVKRRKTRISDVLPDALDMVSICLDAGLGLDQAIVRVGQELRSTHRDLSDELMQINFEQRAGVPRIDSWRAFADRVDIDSLRQFVAMLVQTERFGTPLGVALSSFSDSLRTERRQKAEELGAKAAIKLMFPLVLFIFPMVFIVTVGPAVVGLLKNVVNLLQ